VFSRCKNLRRRRRSRRRRRRRRRAIDARIVVAGKNDIESCFPKKFIRSSSVHAGTVAVIWRCTSNKSFLLFFGYFIWYFFFFFYKLEKDNFYFISSADTLHSRHGYSQWIAMKKAKKPKLNIRKTKLYIYLCTCIIIYIVHVLTYTKLASSTKNFLDNRWRDYIIMCYTSKSIGQLCALQNFNYILCYL